MKSSDQTEKEKPDAGNNAGGPQVEFLDLNTNREYAFNVKWTDTLQSALNTAYTKIGEAPTEEDKLLCEKDGASLMGYLALTFENLRDQHICSSRKYKLRRKTGGA